ncbi:hypothetical protein TNCV_1245681 [Trichonephila clavipes]|uniref:Uncharacterized protein n=1 Tax=Trichonephila clavipes TaxID=2585209 RepID=A0A8X6UX71_TRICX|nr:hypothetical protein TNCV_1245681 [Trichonephila clavipes]
MVYLEHPLCRGKSEQKRQQVVLCYLVERCCLRGLQDGVQSNSNSVAQQPIRAKTYCAHLSVRNQWALRCLIRCHDQVVSLKRDPKCFSLQASLVLIYRSTEGGLKGCVDLPQPKDKNHEPVV